MSLLSRLFGRKAPAAAAPLPPVPVTPPVPSSAEPVQAPELKWLEELQQLGTPDGPAAARAQELVRILSQTPWERRALEAVQRAQSKGLRDAPLLVQCAKLYVLRGQHDAALLCLEPIEQGPGLLLRADLLAEAGQYAQALRCVEQVLASDFDCPGARERHQRWTHRLALRPLSPPISPAAKDVTVAVPLLQQAPFQLMREVARGGAGTVYEAFDQSLERSIALKVYHRTRLAQDQVRREAQLAVRLTGPGIVRVYDCDPEQGWIALEWIARGSLRDLLASKRLEPLMPLERWTLPLAQSLARVHANGLVHADIKPANVLLRAPGEPVLSDFGIAVSSGAPCPAGSSGYLSPERLAGANLTPSDDVFAFGRILQEVLSSVSNSDGTLAGWHQLATQCLAPMGSRPLDGTRLCAALQSIDSRCLLP